MTSFGAVSYHGALYTYGGYFGTPHAYSREGQSGELLRIDPDAHTVDSVLSGEGVQGAQLVASEHELIRVGGMRAENAADESERLVSLDDVARYDEQAGRFHPLSSLPEPRSSHAALLFGGKLYVLGGWILAGEKSSARFAESTLVFDLESKKWQAVAQPFRVRAAGAGVVNGKIVLVGGLDPSGTPQKSVHVLDPETLTWSEGKDYPSDAFGIAVTYGKAALYASAKDGILRELSDAAGEFHDLAALAFPRFFHQLVMLDDEHVAALGGISGMAAGRIAHVELLDLNSKTPRVLSFTLRNPSPAKNRQGVGLLGGELVVFGGNRSLGQHDFAPEDFCHDAFALGLASMHFRALPPFPFARQTVQTLPLREGLFALGGFGHDGDRARAHAEAYLYDPERNAWLAHGSVLPSPRTQFGLTSYNDELWVFGGLDYDPSRPESFVHPTEVLKAAKGAPFADAGVRLPHARRAFGGALLDGRYVLVGGMAEGFQPVSTCDTFEFASSTWSTIPCPAARISAQLVALDGKLYLAGGSMPGQGQELVPSRSLEVFDPHDNAWHTLLDDIPLEPRHLAMVAYKHSLLLYSAQREDSSVAVALIVPPLSSP
jgi:N-acetylneuraminic acid mutarotase